MAPHLTVHEEGVAIVAPGTSEVDLVHAFGSNQPTMVEDITVRLVLRRRGRCDVTVDEALDGAVLEPCCAGAEDEVGSAADIAALEP